MENFSIFEYFVNNDLANTLPIAGNDDFQMSNNSPPLDFSIIPFAQAGPPLLGPNDDLNNFFTPNKNIEAFENPIEPTIMPRSQWDNGSVMQVLGQQQGFPFPVQAPSTTQQQMPTDLAEPISVIPKSSAEPVAVPNSAHTLKEKTVVSEVPEQPKRGRTRNKKNKPPPSAEQERQKRERFLARNRAAASKCRMRKKESMTNIMEKAAKLKRDTIMLRRQLHEAKELYAQYLGLAAEHAERCSSNSDMQGHLKSAGEKGFLPQQVQITIDINDMNVSDTISLGHTGPTLDNDIGHFHEHAEGPAIMSRRNSQQSILSHQSDYSRMHGLQHANIQAGYTANQLHEVRSSLERMEQIVCSHTQIRTLSQHFDGAELDQTLEMSRQHSFASQESAACSRHGSYSSTGQISHEDSGYGSNRTSPKSQKACSPADSIISKSNPPMMANLRATGSITSIETLPICES